MTGVQTCALPISLISLSKFYCCFDCILSANCLPIIFTYLYASEEKCIRMIFSDAIKPGIDRPYIDSLITKQTKTLAQRYNVWWQSHHKWLSKQTPIGCYSTVEYSSLVRVLKSHNYFIDYYVISILTYLHINFIFSSQTSSLFVIWRYVWDNIKEHNTEYNQQHFTRYTDYVRIYFHIHKCGWYLASCL